jgi:hypothetical protein
MKTDYKSRITKLDEEENIIRDKKVKLLLEWGDDFCNWINDNISKQRGKYCYLRHNNTYIAVHSVRNSFVKVNPNVMSRVGVMGSIVLSGFRFIKDNMFLDRAIHNEYFVDNLQEFDIISEEEFNEKYENAIKQLFSLDQVNICRQYAYTDSYHLENLKEKCPDFLNRSEVDNMITALNNLNELEYNEI